MNDLTKKIKTGLKNNPESKKDELIRKAVAAITTAVFIFSGVPVPTSFANSHQTVMNELNQPVSTVTLEQANAAAPATRGSIPSGAAIPADNPLSSLTPEAVPSGWTVAANNANYAFKIEYTGSYSHLKLLDLKTSTEKTLCSVWGGGHYPSRFTGNYDVSPDGSTVFYETTTSGYGVGINLERIRNSEEKLHFRGPLESISFENDGQIAVIVVEDDSEPIKVDLQTFKQLPPAIILQARHVRDVEISESTRQIYYLEQNGKNLVIVYNPKTRVYHQYTVPGFDPFTTNTAKSPHTLTVPEGGHYAVITMGDSSTVYTVPLRNMDEESVRSVKVPGVVAGDGVASLVWRSVDLADMVMKSGAKYTLKVDTFGQPVIPTSESTPEDPEFWETIYILPSSQAERVADTDSLMELLASKGITRITRDQVEALKLAQTDRMHILRAAYYLSQNGDQIAIAFSAVKEYGSTVKGGVPSWRPHSQSFFSNILYSASPDSDPVVIHRAACVAHMGFTADGLLAIEGESSGSSVHNSRGELVALGDRVVELHSVPNGWTRAASNANYAFKIEYTGSYSHLKLLDLKTSTEKTLCSVWGGGHYPSRFTGNYGVSPDGSTVFYETTTSGYGVGINLERIRNPEEKLHFRGSLESISFENDGRFAVIAVKDASEPIIVDLRRFKEGYFVPSGWTQAASNARYAFQIQSTTEWTGGLTRRCSHLRILDLKASIVWTVHSILEEGQDPVRFTGHYDVSPDGSTVIYETTQAGHGVGITLKRLRNFEEKLYFRGPLESSIRFENDDQIAIIAVKGVSEPIKVDLQTFKQLPPAIILQARHVRDVEVLSSTRQIYYLEQNGKNLVIVYNPKTRVYHQYTVPGFDPFTTNTAKSPHTLTVPEGGHYAVITMGNSSTVYTVPLRNIDGEFVRSVRVPGVVARDGVASLVWRTASLADMVMKSGAKYTLKVDSFGRLVTTPLMPPVPSGWTRAASNANFAFRVQRVGVTERLYVMDLKTGARQLLLSVGRTRNVANVFDVSPDGTTVIYGTRSSSKKTANYTYVQRIGGSSKKLVLSGTLRSVSYASNGKIATLVLKKNNSSTIRGARVDLLRLTLLR